MFSQRFFLTIFFIYQLISTGAIIVGAWPQEVVYFNLALQLGVLFLFDLEYALYSVILSIPFYLVVPNPYFDSFSAWRFVFIVLFGLFVYRQRKQKSAAGLVWSPWDRNLLFLVLMIILSILFAEFQLVGLKRLL